jgi:hypothetical protein
MMVILVRSHVKLVGFESESAEVDQDLFEKSTVFSNFWSMNVARRRRSPFLGYFIISRLAETAIARQQLLECQPKNFPAGISSPPF